MNISIHVFRFLCLPLLCIVLAGSLAARELARDVVQISLTEAEHGATLRLPGGGDGPASGRMVRLSYDPGSGTLSLADMPADNAGAPAATTVGGTITGSVFYDMDLDEELDPDEGPLVGAAVSFALHTVVTNACGDVISANTHQDSATTDSEGRFSFTYTFTEDEQTSISYSVTVHEAFGFVAIPSPASGSLSAGNPSRTLSFIVQPEDQDDDTIPDLVEGPSDDFDSDGYPDYLDYDADDDHLADLLESGMTGYPFSWQPQDNDGDGDPDYIDRDSDDDGLPDGPTYAGWEEAEGVQSPEHETYGHERCFLIAIYSGCVLYLADDYEDIDADGLPDQWDLDADDDGVPDGVEAGVTLEEVRARADGTDVSSSSFHPDADPETRTDPHDQDSDDDGLMDGNEDRNGDGKCGDQETDASRYDTDDDGLSDSLEQGLEVPETDDTDLETFSADQDPSTTTDPLLADTDAGSVIDGVEDVNQNGRVDDHEIDPNNHDDDADFDQDGLTDQVEGELGSDKADPDTDDDGLLDSLDGCEDVDGSRLLLAEECLDSDGDGEHDLLESDADGDGLKDGTEAGLIQPHDPDALEVLTEFIEDHDPTTRTDPGDADTDDDGLSDGGGQGSGGLLGEDLNRNGAQDPGETAADKADSDRDGLRDGVELGLQQSQAGTTVDGVPWTDPTRFTPDMDPLQNTLVLDADSDDDCVPDGVEDRNGNGMHDTGEPSNRDIDSDADGVMDGTEMGATAPVAATTLYAGTAAGRCIPDLDSSTRTDPALDDSDGGGLEDGEEDWDGNGRIDTGETDPNLSTDDYDLGDADDDGLINVVEDMYSLEESDADSDDDGIPDGDEGVADPDGDGLINALDTDSDGDGILDRIERCIADEDSVTPTPAEAGEGDGNADGSPSPGPGGTPEASATPVPEGTPAPSVPPSQPGTPTGAPEASPSPTLEPDSADASAPCTFSDPYDADSDDDGLADQEEDQNLNGRRDPGETAPSEQDSDADGLQDGTELGRIEAGVDRRFTGAAFRADRDPITTTDPCDDDTDDDGIVDGNEDLDRDGCFDPFLNDDCEPQLPEQATASHESGETTACPPLEPFTRETRATSADTDGDCVQDGTELGLQTAQGRHTDLAVFNPDRHDDRCTDPLVVEYGDLNCDGTVGYPVAESGDFGVSFSCATAPGGAPRAAGRPVTWVVFLFSFLLWRIGRQRARCLEPSRRAVPLLLLLLPLGAAWADGGVSAPPARTTGIGILRVFSAVEGTTVLLDGRRLGITPLLWRVSSGPHTVTLQTPGYRSHMERIEVLGGRLHTVNARLEPLPFRHRNDDVPGRELLEPAGGGAAGHGEPSDPASTSARGRVHVLALGVSTFQEESLRLDYAHSDAEAFMRRMQESLGMALAPGSILLTNAAATRSTTFAALSEILKRAEPNDMIIIFTATHALIDDAGELQFVLHDTNLKNLMATGLAQSDLEKLIRRSPAKKVLLIADACHAGSLGESVELRERRGVTLAEANTHITLLAQARDGVAILAASSAAESSWESVEWRGGIFTHFLLEALEGKADSDANRVVTLREAFNHIYIGVNDATRGNQHPELKGRYDNDLPLVVLPMPEAVEVSGPAPSPEGGS